MKTLITIMTALLLGAFPAAAEQWQCQPTPQDAQGPFYREGAPVRNEVGKGYLLMGEVKSAADCEPIAGAKIELWTTGPDGRYDDRWRATVFANEDGRYYFRTAFPGRYGSRPPHIHILVNAQGYQELVTQHYPKPATGEAIFDLVLKPE